ncbi:hypothetical protein ACFQPF_15785 [Fictibacillus iocasae]|uniref:Uncharacterized protein n=1 Tax=Fictibacillus iocasae TaxID=2715437 RepID=A0ABW2NRL6_9BACL
MPVYTTGAISNTPVNGVRPTSSVTVKLVNNTNYETVNIQGYYLNGLRQQYVEEVFTIGPGEVITKQYFADVDTFEFIFNIPDPNSVEISVFGKDQQGALVDAHRLVASEIASINELTNVFISDINPNFNSQFADLRTVEKTLFIEYKSVYGLSDLRDVVFTSGAGSVTNNATEYLISTSGAGDVAILETAERGNYQPGFASEAGVGVRLPAVPIGGQTARWGMFDDQNGFFFGMNAQTLFVGIRREGTEEVIPQAEWNVDPLNGTGPAGITLNPADGNIYQITYSWYGYGVVEFKVVLQAQESEPQTVVTVHRFKTIGQTSVADPDLPLRGEVQNNGTANPLTLFMAGRSYGILGRPNPEFRITSERRPVTVDVSPFPILSFVRKPEFPAGSNRRNSVSVRLEGVDLASTAPLFFEIRIGGELNGEFVDFPTDTTPIPSSETALLVNKTATAITGGQVIFQGVAAGGGTFRDLLSTSLLEIELPAFLPVTLVAGTFSGISTVNAALRMTEEW